VRTQSSRIYQLSTLLHPCDKIIADKADSGQCGLFLQTNEAQNIATRMAVSPRVSQAFSREDGPCKGGNHEGAEKLDAFFNSVGFQW
jgi:hypothetical protein